MSTLYELIGEDGFARLTEKFYQSVPDDDVLGPMYPAEALDAAESRLRSFLVYRFGGPQNYIVERGHPRLRIRHAPFMINQAARDRWVQLMTAALAEMGFPVEVAAELRQFFEESATFLINAA